MIALSIRQPWAWLILHGGKDVENRQWPTKYRGRILIHASKGVTRAEHEDAEDFALCRRGVRPSPFPKWKDYPLGGIVGEVEIIDCVTASDSPWFVGAFGFVLRNPKVLPFTPYRGALGFFDAAIDAARGKP